MEHFVYILYSDTLDRYYVGTSENVSQRLEYHNNPVESRKYTAKGLPWRLMTQLTFSDKLTAVRVEKYIKRMKSRKFVEAIIAGKVKIEELTRLST